MANDAAIRSTLEDIISVYEWCCVDPVDRGYSALDNEISRAKNLLSSLTPDAQTQQHLGQGHVPKGTSGKPGERANYSPDIPEGK